MRRAFATAAACALAAAIVPLALSTTATASSGQLLIDVVGDNHGWVHDSSQPLFHFDKLAPGSSTSATLRLKNDSSSRATLSVKAIHVHDDDNGCLPQERAAGDTTCGRGGGELGKTVRFAVVCPAVSASRPLWSGTISDVEKGVTLPQSLGPMAVIELHVTAELPHSAGNETMTDRLGFDLAWTLSGTQSKSTAIVRGVPFVGGGAHPPYGKLAAIPSFVGALGLAAGWRRRVRGVGLHRR
ncbi:MAG TPA: hypothetical protein VFN80_00200 [Acidothermaceae bacterium]|nr:hypothetical protein [Acidothermaceae bacterium]